MGRFVPSSQLLLRRGASVSYTHLVVHRVPWVKADNVVVAFYIFPLLVLPIAEIGVHTGNGKILVAAVQRGYSIVLPEHCLLYTSVPVLEAVPFSFHLKMEHSRLRAS